LQIRVTVESINLADIYHCSIDQGQDFFQTAGKDGSHTVNHKFLSFQILSLGILTSAISTAAAQTITAATCNASDVQTAFNAVTASTTTVKLPAGTCTWTTQVKLTIPNGSATLSILGAGNLSTTGGGDQTVIVDNYASSNSPLIITTNSTTSSQVRLAGVTFEGGASGDTKYTGFVQILGSSQNIRLDHSHFNTSTYGSSGANSSGVQYNGCTYGVVDHSIFDEAADSTSNAVRAYNSGTCFGDSLGIGDQSWAHSTSLGSSSFLFIESNVFNNGASDDCTNGGRFVFRFNTFNATTPAPSVQTHPTGGAGRIRGCRAWEVYENTFTATADNYMNAGIWISSGTGVVWGNTFPSSSAGGGTGYRSAIELLDMRANSSTYPQTAPPGGWGYCGTAQTGTASNWDQDTNSSGYACLDQPGRGIGDFLTGGFSSDGSGSNNACDSTQNPGGCSSNTGQWVNEALEPIYEWTDNYSPVPNNPSAVLSVDEGTFTANKDYYLWCSASSQAGCTSFTGTSGVGSGTLAARPSTCTTGVAYWATDQGNWNASGNGGQGELFKCTATNTWTLFYTPYTYPHPLTSTTATPQPPASVSGKAVPQS
jgi:hypothetical protein